LNTGRFIVLDGPDGCGKSTQAKMLVQAIAGKYPEKEIITTREPGGTAAGEEIRDMLLHHYPDGATLFSETEVYLFFAARAQLVREIITPALGEGKIIICERWVSATLAYQGYAGSVAVEQIKETGRLALDDIEPHLSLILDVKAGDGLDRIEGEADRIEAKSLEFHKKVREGFHKIVEQCENAVLIEAGTIEETHKRVLQEVERVL
jgi:dTMP kinase